MVRHIVNALVLCAVGAFICTGLTGAEAVEKAFVTPKKSDKCPVCGMFVAKYPEWVAEIVFKDGTYVVFDGAKDMFKYYLNPEKYAPKKTRNDISSVYVTDYYSITNTDGMKAFYVAGSDVLGPMGHELIPFYKESDAAGFMKDHKGKKIVRFKDVDASMLRTLD